MTDPIPLARGLALVTRESYEHYGASFLRQLYPNSDIFVAGVPLEEYEALKDPRCYYCDGPYIENTLEPEWEEDYGGYAHAPDCGVIVFGEALVACAEAEDAENAR